MPCGAPCDRLPCDERCEKILPCGHQCPGVCGEICLDDYCQECGDKRDSRVDLLEMRTYAEIDLNTEPVIALSCGHFFTMETLDRMTSMDDIYVLDSDGRFDGLRDISSQLAWETPVCPYCVCPMRQNVAYRYGRLVNRAVVDSMTKKFIMNGEAELLRLSNNVDDLLRIIEESKAAIKSRADRVLMIDWRSQRDDKKGISTCISLKKEIDVFAATVADGNQPAQKIHQAIIHAKRRITDRPIDEGLENLKLESKLVSNPTRPVLLGARLLRIRIQQMMLQDQDLIASLIDQKNRKELDAFFRMPTVERILSLLDVYKILINDCLDIKLSKLAVQAILCFADTIACSRAISASQSEREKLTAQAEVAKSLLNDARDNYLQGLQGSQTLATAVELMIQRLTTEWYERVTSEEMQMIRAAMLNGRDSLASHSGHWYNCVNGHPFAIGECGMPMELARCPECGASIGGQHHQAVAGVSRATEMEQ